MATQITLLPKDAEGKEVPLDVEGLYDEDGNYRYVACFSYHPMAANTDKAWTLEYKNGVEKFVSQMYLIQPDSWKKLEEDLDRCIKKGNTCMYFSEYGTCNSCSAYGKGTGVHACPMKVIKDIKNRIRNLRKKDNN